MRRHVGQSAQRDAATTYFWICDFCIRQNNAKEDVGRLGEMVTSIGRTVMYLEGAVRACCTRHFDDN